VRDEDRKQMLRPINAIVIVVAVALCVAPASYPACLEWIEKEGSSCSNWDTFITSFQTLISRVSAIAAAGIAVYQMRGSDKEQLKPHEEIVAVETRAGRNHIQRGLRRIKATLSGAVIATNNFLKYARPLNQADWQDGNPIPALNWTPEGREHFKQLGLSCYAFMLAAKSATVQKAFAELPAEFEEKLNQCIAYAKAILPAAAEGTPDFTKFRNALLVYDDRGAPREFVPVSIFPMMHFTNYCVELIAMIGSYDGEEIE
jgi:hypothetical protein